MISTLLRIVSSQQNYESPPAKGIGSLLEEKKNLIIKRASLFHFFVINNTPDKQTMYENEPDTFLTTRCFVIFVIRFYLTAFIITNYNNY